MTSREGVGTDVLLTWTAAAPRPSSPILALVGRTLTPPMMLGTVVLAMNIVMGEPQWRGQPLALALSAIGGIILVTSAAAWSPARRLTAALLSSVSTIVVIFVTLSTPPDAEADWRYWYLGALAPFVGALAFRHARGTGPWVVALMTVAVSISDAASGRPFWSCFFGPVPVLLATGVAGQLLREALDDIWRRVSDARADDLAANSLLVVERERARIAAARGALLVECFGAALLKISKGARSERDWAVECAALETAARAHLAAPDLVDAELIEHIRASRARGVRIDVVSGGSMTGDPQAIIGSDVPRCRKLFTGLLVDVPPGTRLRLVWEVKNGRPTGDLTAVGPSLDHAASRLMSAISQMPLPERPKVSTDEGSILVQFR